MHDSKVIRLTIRLPEKLKAELEKQATEERRSLNAQVVTTLEGSLKKAA